MPVWRLVPMSIVHRLSMKLRPMIRRVFPTRREPSVIALAVIQTVIYMPVEMISPVKPRSRADKDAAVVPLRTVIPVRRARIRRSLVIAVRASRFHADPDRYLRRRLGRGRKQQSCRDRHS